MAKASTPRAPVAKVSVPKDPVPTAPTPTESAPPSGSRLGCLANLFWLLVCPGVLGLTAMAIVVSGKPGLQRLDLLYWVLVLLAPSARYLEIQLTRPAVADGEPDAMTGWRGYAARFTAVSAGLWLAAHGVAYLVAR